MVSPIAAQPIAAHSGLTASAIKVQQDAERIMEEAQRMHEELQPIEAAKEELRAAQQAWLGSKQGLDQNADSLSRWRVAIVMLTFTMVGVTVVGALKLSKTSPGYYRARPDVGGIKWIQIINRPELLKG